METRRTVRSETCGAESEVVRRVRIDQSKDAQPALARHRSLPAPPAPHLPLTSSLRRGASKQGSVRNGTLGVVRRSLHATPRAKEERLPERYRLLHLLGRGSYGCVWEGVDKQTGAPVAVKRVSQLFRDLVDCKRILREIAILSKLDHPGVVRLYDVPPVADVSCFDELYMVMELGDSDLGKLLRAEVSLTALHVYAVFYSLLLGLGYLHACGVYHRDLKPANCLVNQDCSVKICDFGLARAVGVGDAQQEADEEADAAAPVEAAAVPPPTSRRMRLRRHLTSHVATRWYRAPELILLQDDYSEAVDVWSAGCIYAELLGMLEGVELSQRSPLFPGSTCYPLSPHVAHMGDHRFHSEENHEQLNVIFDILGTPTEADLDFLQRQEARRYVGCFAARQGSGLRERFSLAEDQAVEVLQETLNFNPRRRPSVDILLRNTLFDEVRDPSREEMSPTSVRLDFDTQQLDEFRLRSFFLREMSKLKARQADAVTVTTQSPPTEPPASSSSSASPTSSSSGSEDAAACGGA